MASNFTFFRLTDVLRAPNTFETVACISLVCFLLYRTQRFFWPRSTSLPGPPSDSWIWGVSKVLSDAEDPAVLLEQWAKQYGPAFRVPGPLGSSRVVLCDPKAVAYFYSRDTPGFKIRKLGKIFVKRLLGGGIISAEGDSHKRQRKALTPAFSNQAIRALTSVFFDSAYKVKAAWDTSLDAAPSGEASIDVQAWMNKVSLDTIGIAGFSHDFGTLEGRHSEVAEVFDSFSQTKPKGRSFTSFVLPLLSLLMPVLPFLAKLPTGRGKTILKLNNAMGHISNDLLKRTRLEKGATRIGDGKGPKSLIETLILAEGSQNELSLSESEVLAQMKTLILAGYETTSISLTWALINLSLHPKIQDSLRVELSQLNGDPTFEQLSSLPHLDAVAKETFRLHPPATETIRDAAEDHVIPLSVPLTTPKGEITNTIHITAGTTVSAPIRLLNRSKAIWGEDAHEFIPARWMASEGIPERAKEIRGYSNLLTFIDGPRTCLGKQFAITEFKAVLATLIRHYEFRFHGEADTKFEKVLGILPRPKVAGEEGSKVPILVKRVD